MPRSVIHEECRLQVQRPRHSKKIFLNKKITKSGANLNTLNLKKKKHNKTKKEKI